MYPHEASELVHNTLAEILCDDPGTRYPLQATFAQLGLDSLDVIDLIHSLNRACPALDLDRDDFSRKIPWPQITVASIIVAIAAKPIPILVNLKNSFEESRT